ncbi:MAG: hypothetical protein ABI478_08185 [Propionivibrio sp.]
MLAEYRRWWTETEHAAALRIEQSAADHVVVEIGHAKPVDAAVGRH